MAKTPYNEWERMVRVQLRMDPVTLAELDQLARSHGLNRSAMVRLLVSQAADGAGTTTRPIEDH